MGETLNSKWLPVLTKIGVFRHHTHKIFAPVGPFKRQMFEYKNCTSNEDIIKPSHPNLHKKLTWRTKTKRLLLRFVFYRQYSNILVISTGIFYIMLSSADIWFGEVYYNEFLYNVSYCKIFIYFVCVNSTNFTSCQIQLVHPIARISWLAFKLS